MNPSLLRPGRVLALDPTCQGFGFAVFEGPEKLVDWGRKQVRADRNRTCVKKVTELIGLYRPEVLVVERISAKDCRRRARVRRLITTLLVLSRRRRLRARQISRRRVLKCFAQLGAATKYQVAVALVDRFPELKPHLPPERKIGDNEDERMGILDAVAFGWTSYEPLRRGRCALARLDEPASLPNA